MISRRRLLAWMLGAASAAMAQDDEAPRRVILDASRALQAGNPDRFMGYFDRRQFRGPSELRRSIYALLEAREVASSVDVLSIADGPNGKVAQVDWLLQLTPLNSPGEVDKRQQTVELTLTQQPSGDWRIASLEPVAFFRVL